VAIVAHDKGRAELDHLVYGVAHLDLDSFSLTLHAHVRTAKFTHQVQRRLGLLAQSQAQGVFLTPLAHRLVHITGQTVEAVSRALAPDALVHPLMIVVAHPVLDALAGITKGGKDRLAQKLLPNRAPEALDLTQRHRVVRRTAHMLHALLLEHLLEARLAPPGHKLPAVVRQDLARRAPLAQRPLDHFQHRLGRLLPKQPVTHDVAAVVVDHPHQIHRVQTLELKRHDVYLPHGVGEAALKAAHLRWPALAGRRPLAQTRVVDHPPHRLRAHLQALVPLQLVTDAPHPMLRVLSAVCLDALLNDLVKAAPTLTPSLLAQRAWAALLVGARPRFH